MATHPNIADADMNYFQFKARQWILLQKEDAEWQDFCKQVAPDCLACLAEEKTNSVGFKDIGIQTVPKSPFNKTEKVSYVPKQQKDQIPEALYNIKTRLEKIDLALSKICDAPEENAKEKPRLQMTVCKAPNERTERSFEEQRKLVIQNSLKASLQKLHGSYSGVPKALPSAIKVKNSSFFIPHDLQVKRDASRRAYLKSLQTKPKVSFKNLNQNSSKNIPITENKKTVPKHTKNLKKNKSITQKECKDSNLEEQNTLIAKDSEEKEAKDENIECLVDGILDDLIGDAALDLNKIRQRRRDREHSSTNKERKTNAPSYSSTPALRKNFELDATEDDGNNTIMKLKSFLDFSEETKQKNDRKGDLVDKSINTSQNEFPTNVIERNGYNSYISENKDPPKFICSVKNVITIEPEEIKQISQNKERFWKYLKNISRTVKGDFNPWIINETLAESILDDCINDIAEELSAMPSNFIQDLYNQEFVQQVQD